MAWWPCGAVPVAQGGDAISPLWTVHLRGAIVSLLITLELREGVRSQIVRTWILTVGVGSREHGI